MAIQTTYTDARANLAKLLNEVTNNREIVVIRRRGEEDVAMIASSELAGLAETAHLLRSPKNAQRLLAALRRAQEGEEEPMSLAELRREVGVAEKE